VEFAFVPWFEIIVGYVMQWLVTVDTTIHGRLHCSLQAIPLQKKSILMSFKKVLQNCNWGCILS